jgi:hypothetical protein
MGEIFRKIGIGIVLVYLGIVAFLFILTLWDVTIGDLLIRLLKVSAPLIIIFLIFQAVIFTLKFRARRLEKKYGSQGLYRVLYDTKRLYHCSYCTDVVVNKGNLVFVNNPEEAQAEGLSPCPKCRPPVSNQQIRREII